MRVRASLAAVLLVGMATLAAAQTGTATPTPLPAAVAEAFRAIRADPPSLTAGKHFLVSDEKGHHVFRAAITELGGLLLGVGTDQNYLMAGWARPDLLMLLDFDPMVADLHLAYRELFLAAPTPERFRELWHKDAAGEVEALLGRAYEDAARRKLIVRAYRTARGAVSRKLRVTLRTAARAGVPTFLDDPEQYAFLRGLFQANRVFSVRGDLTATEAMKDVAEAARAGGIPVRVLYLSNAERYFRYNQAFLDNIRRLPFDDRTIVLRTAGPGARRLARVDGHYSYFVQSGADFLAWLAAPGGRSVHRILRATAPVPDVKGLYTLGGPPSPD